MAVAPLAVVAAEAAELRMWLPDSAHDVMMATLYSVQVASMMMLHVCDVRAFASGVTDWKSASGGESGGGSAA